MKSGHIEYSEQTYMGKTDYVLTAYSNNEEVFKENFCYKGRSIKGKRCYLWLPLLLWPW